MARRTPAPSAPSLFPDHSSGVALARRSIRCPRPACSPAPTADNSYYPTACSLYRSRRSPTISTCGAPIAKSDIDSGSTRWPKRSASSSRARTCSLASNVVAAAILEASLRAQIEATERIITAQRGTLDILTRQSGLGAVTGADVAAQQAALAQVEVAYPSAAAEGPGATAQPACRADGPADERIDVKCISVSPISGCRRSCRSACPRRWSSSGRTCARQYSNLHSASALVGLVIANQFPNIVINARHRHLSRSRSGTLFGPLNFESNAVASALQTLIDGGALAAEETRGAGTGTGRRTIPLDDHRRIPQRRRLRCGP